MTLRGTTKNAKGAKVKRPNPTVPPLLSTAGAGKVRLGDVFDLQMGKTPARARHEYWYGANKWISIADIGKANVFISKTAEGISDKAVMESGIKLVPANTLIMSFKLSIGKTAITAEPMYTNEAIMAFLPKPNVEFDLHYLYHQFSNKDWSTGSNLAVIGLTLNKKSLQEHVILSPPLPTQQRIADELDQLCALKKNAEDRLAILDQIVKSRFVEMFGDVENDVRDFPVATIEALCEDSFWIMPATPEYVEDGEVRYITSKNIKGGSVDFNGCKRISHESFCEISAKRPIKVGDFLVSMIGTLGEVAIVSDQDGEFYGQNMFLLRPDEAKVDRLYLFTYLTHSSYVRHIIDRSKNSSTQAYLKREHVVGMLIPQPPLALQREFAAFVTEVDKSKLTLRETVATLDQLYRAKLQEYFG